MPTPFIFDLFKVAEVELVYRSLPGVHDRPIITRSSISYEILRHHWDRDKIELQEQFKILLLNRRNACLGIAEIGTGGQTSCIADPRLIFATALKANATGIILAHNHPSGSLKPSEPDRQLTRNMVNAGKILDITVLDHVIITSHGYTSFADSGLLP